MLQVTRRHYDTDAPSTNAARAPCARLTKVFAAAAVATNLALHASPHGGRIGAEHHVRIEHGEQPAQVTNASSPWQHGATRPISPMPSALPWRIPNR